MYKNIYSPDAGWSFNRWMGSPPAQSKAETRLAELRIAHGNAAGTRLFREELATRRRDYLR